MGYIPEDAIHWDSGDWIDWHRQTDGLDNRPCSAASHDDQLARLTALQVSLVRAAKTYFMLTDRHLPIYPAIAEVYASIHFDLPVGTDAALERGVKLAHLTPNGSGNAVEVDLGQDFDLLVIVRIRENFSIEARTIRRDKLPKRNKGIHTINWQSLPRRT